MASHSHVPKSAEFVLPPSKRQRANNNGGSITLSTEESGAKNQRKSSSHEEANATSLWDAAVKTELERYAKTTSDREGGSYRPGPISKDQLLKAAKEFVKRCDEGDDESLPFVLVSQNCEDIPSREFELDALQSSEICKLWYALTKAKDLLIIKVASDTVHGDAVGELVRCIGNFGMQYGARGHRLFSWGTDGKRVLLSGTAVAADAVLQLSFPAQGRPEQLRAHFIAELEYENRGPKALMLQLCEYLLQPVADYVLGIKVYKRSGPPAPAGAKRPFAAIALLWRRGAAPPGNQASFVGAWSFGTCALQSQSIAAFCRERGNLEKVQPRQIVHPVSHNVASDTIAIPNAQYNCDTKCTSSSWSCR